MLTHKWGGNITRVRAIGHETSGGVASWYFVADVAWNDRTLSESSNVAPNFVCFPNGDPEGLALMDALAEYLRKRGRWHDPKRTADGRVYYWTPHKLSGRKTLTGGKP